VAKVGTSNQDRTISLKAAVRSCINKLVFFVVRNLKNTIWAHLVSYNPFTRLLSSADMTLSRSFITMTATKTVLACSECD